MRILTVSSARQFAVALLAVIVLAACRERTASRAAGAHSVADLPRRFSIADSASSDGGRRRSGQCARALSDRDSRTHLVLRGWDERTRQERRGDTTVVESYEHGFYMPADARAVGLAPGQEYEVDCRTFEAVGVNTPDVRPDL
jgi:hypothetical protein